MTSSYSIVQPIGFTMAHCGYCQSPDSSAHVYSSWAYRLTCQHYQDLLNRGWKRAGLYLYRPNARDSCCAQYSIRLNAPKFSPSKNQRRLMVRFNRKVAEYDPAKGGLDQTHASNNTSSSTLNSDSTTGAVDSNNSHHDCCGDHSSASPEPSFHTLPSAHRGRSMSMSPVLGSGKDHTDFLRLVRAAEQDKLADKALNMEQEDSNGFRVRLEVPSLTQEKYLLYCKYQKFVHGVTDEIKLSEETFKSCVVDTPLISQPAKSNMDNSASHIALGFGTFHQCYYLGTKLMAFGVLDILPNGISSDSFYYDPEFSVLSLGKYSTLREIGLVQELRELGGDYGQMEYYTMGHYIHTCSKMNYKATYQPSELLDPETYKWMPFEECAEQLRFSRYASFSDPIQYNFRVQSLLVTIETEKRVKEKARQLQQQQQQRQEEKLLAPDHPLSTVALPLDHQQTESMDIVKNGKRLMPMHDDEQEQRERRPSTGSLDGSIKRVKHEAEIRFPAPGMMDPKDVTMEQLGALVAFNRGKASVLTDLEVFKATPTLKRSMQEYYSAAGPALAQSMLVYLA